jgi:hypothetical protein
MGFCPSLENKELVFHSNREVLCSIVEDIGVFCSNPEGKVLKFDSPIDVDVQEELADEFSIGATVPVGQLL